MAMDLFRELDRLLGTPGTARPGAPGDAWPPPLDVFDRKDDVLVKVELPGVKPELVDIEIDEGVLSIRGERPFEEEVEQGRYHRIERRYGPFERSLALPAGMDAEAVEASFADGVLEIRIPKRASAKPKRITIERA